MHDAGSADKCGCEVISEFISHSSNWLSILYTLVILRMQADKSCFVHYLKLSFLPNFGQKSTNIASEVFILNFEFLFLACQEGFYDEWRR
jgi:hypothetical protein